MHDENVSLGSNTDTQDHTNIVPEYACKQHFVERQGSVLSVGAACERMFNLYGKTRLQWKEGSAVLPSGTFCWLLVRQLKTPLELLSACPRGSQNESCHGASRRQLRLETVAVDCRSPALLGDTDATGKDHSETRTPSALCGQLGQLARDRASTRHLCRFVPERIMEEPGPSAHHAQPSTSKHGHDMSLKYGAPDVKRLSNGNILIEAIEIQ